MTTKPTLWYLQNHSLMKNLTQHELMQLVPLMNRKLHPKGSTIYVKMEFPYNVYFLKTGKVKILETDENGKESIKTLFSRNDIFGKIPFMESCFENHKVVAVEDSLICTMDAQKFEEAVRNNTRLCTEVLKMIGSQMIKMERRLQSLLFKDAKTRIVEFLRDLTYEHGEMLGDEIFVSLPLSHKEIACLTATSRQTVTTVLNELKSRNAIELKSRKLIVRNIAQLV